MLPFELFPKAGAFEAQRSIQNGSGFGSIHLEDTPDGLCLQHSDVRCSTHEEAAAGHWPRSDRNIEGVIGRGSCRCRWLHVVIIWIG